MTKGATRRAISRDAVRVGSDSTAAELERQIEQLKERMHLAVIFGGDKSAPDTVMYKAQNTRSWKSYEAVACDIAESLRSSGFRHVELMPEDMRLPDRLHRSGIHMAWLNTGGVQGHNSAAHAASLLEMLGVPYVGHDPLATTTLDNKHAFKREAACMGLPTAAFCTWNMARGPFWPEMNSRFLHAFGDFQGPFIVKPVSGRASLHVQVAKDRIELAAVVAEVHAQTGHLILIEKYLPGREFCVAVAGGVTSQDGMIARAREPFAFGVLERNFAPDEMIFTSMDVRPITGARFRAVNAADEPELVLALKRLARDVYLDFNLSSVVRIDLRCDEHGGLYILEANPKPDLKRPCAEATSLIAAGLAQTNLTYDDLIVSLLADRLDVLFLHRRNCVKHLVDLLDGDVAASINLRSACTNDQTGLMVSGLLKTADEMRSA
ncbi:MAG TPA: hypothetical protein VFB45_02160 [Pseudolabrys sp.]|nr:hypothetical protein [Pseudolabrys sp.]